ncbi:MAG: Fe-S metabolism protein SufE [Bacteroidetes bacterium QS_9_68_14]|nr:MAG: Fe-S metabolism protein SufE [Bacteroidetes bacterium QS_9_68_14]
MKPIEDIAAPFQMMEPDMRLELLLEYTEKLPPLPERYAEMRDAGMAMVHECQSPVFLMPEVEQNGDTAGEKTVHVHADVPESAPTARAFTAILHEAFDGATPAQVRQAPDDLLDRLGLSGLLGMQRTQGLAAIYRRLRNEVARQSTAGESTAGQETARSSDGTAEA